MADVRLEVIHVDLVGGRSGIQEDALRRIVDGCFYVLRGGVPWRMMPHDLPPWENVYYHLRTWRRKGTWERINQVLRERHRVARGRKPHPTAAVIDSQSVKTTEAGGPRGYDGGKKVTGRKRQVLVDTEGTLLKTRIHPADIHDKPGGMLLLTCLHILFPSIVLVWADSSYQGLKSWIKEHLGWTLTIARHWWTGVHAVWCAPGQQPPTITSGFHVLPRRWVVERTVAWFTRNRRLAKDYERLPETGEIFLYMAMSQILIKRLAKRLVARHIDFDELRPGLPRDWGSSSHSRFGAGPRPHPRGSLYLSGTTTALALLLVSRPPNLATPPVVWRLNRLGQGLQHLITRIDIPGLVLLPPSSLPRLQLQ